MDGFLVFLQVRRIKICQKSQTLRCQQWKDVGSKGEVVPLVQPLVPHVHRSEVLYVVASPWLNVVEGGCDNSLKIIHIMKMWNMMNTKRQEVFEEH